MCHASIPLTNVVEGETLQRMQTRDSFTALDISNALKTARYPVRHREVAEVVRDIYNSGAMAHYDYDRRLVQVTTEGGAKTAEAYLYHHRSVRPADYAGLNQDALPPVAPDQARDLSDCVAADPLGLLARVASVDAAAQRRTQNTSGRSAHGRRDGALPVPARIIAQLGWTDGSALVVRVETGKLIVEPVCAWAFPDARAQAGMQSGTRTGTQAASTVRVWGGRRVRICKSKLRLVALDADAVTVSINGSSLQIAALP